MRAVVTPVRIADDVLEIAVDSPAIAQALAKHLRELGVAEEIVPGLASVSLRFEPSKEESVMTHLEAITELPVINPPTKEAKTIPVHYGGEYGPDLADISARLGVSDDELVSIHSSVLHTVDMIGFTPGFAYASGLPDTFRIPRLSTPRPRVAAGSIGVSRANTGIYAMVGPGGWPVIGRTLIPLFDPASDPPFLLRPGQTIRFRAA